MESKSIHIVLIILLSGFPFACGLSSTVAVTFPDGRTVNCELADTPKKLAEGLTTYSSLAPNQGMLFAYPSEQIGLTFWMPNKMKFQIDMIFLDGEKRVVLIEHEVPICESNIPSECDSYGPRDLGVQYVVEVVAGLCKEIDLKVGDQIRFDIP